MKAKGKLLPLTYCNLVACTGVPGQQVVQGVHIKKIEQTCMWLQPDSFSMGTLQVPVQLGTWYVTGVQGQMLMRAPTRTPQPSFTFYEIIEL
jgi:hypothetical protein